MEFTVGAVVCVSLAVTIGQAQTSTQDVSEPSPMEAFAQRPGVHTAWSSEIGRLENGDADDGARAAITALVVENSAAPAERMRGVRVDLVNKVASDRIYLDEEAAKRTKSALESIAEGVARRPLSNNGCFGAKEFWPLYDWPWNKYHELNAEVCNTPAGYGLTLSGRHKPGSFLLLQQGPERLAALLGTALDQLKER
jgi:hypothetical protein